MALGAQAGHILRLVAEQGLWPAGVGLTIGILAGLLLARFVDAFLYGVSAYDPITLALTVLVLGIATLLACLLPAARAIQMNPTSVLARSLTGSNPTNRLTRRLQMAFRIRSFRYVPLLLGTLG